MKKLAAFATAAFLLVGAMTAPASIAKAGTAKVKTWKLSNVDLATADGSVRVGLSGGNIYCTLTSINSDIVLNPDSWTGDDEAKNWNTWLVNFDDALFTQWLNVCDVNAQQTVSIQIVPGSVSVQSWGTYFAVGGGPDINGKFGGEIKTALERTLKGMPPMPTTKNPLKEVRMALTFMRDHSVVPRSGKRDLGFVAVETPAGDNVNVYGRQKDGRSPGIQILSEKGGGNIEVTDAAPFLSRCAEIDGRGL